MKKQIFNNVILTYVPVKMSIDLSFKPKNMKINIIHAPSSGAGLYDFYWLYSDLYNKGTLGYATNRVDYETIVPIENFTNGTYTFWMTNKTGTLLDAGDTINGAVAFVLEFSD